MEQGTATRDPAGAGREAARRYAWREAFDLLTEADSTGSLAPEDLATLGEAAWWIGRQDACISARERAHAGYLEGGDRAGAARMAIALYRDHRYRLEGAVAAGWFQRAERILADVPESAEHGWLERSRAQATFDTDPQAALQMVGRALDVATRLGDKDLQAIALHDQGEFNVRLGKVREGLALTDEATVAAVSGELSPWATGVVYCNTISLCEVLADYRRAGEWTEAAKRWCDRQSIAGFPGICRVHRADVIRLRGRWTEAESEARQACTELQEAGMLMFAGEGFYEIGEIRLRTGDLAAAEDAFRQADEMGREPEPGLTLLRLAEGKTEAAFSGIRRALEDRGDRLGRAKLLPAAVEAAMVAAERDSATRWTEELDSIAQDFGTPALKAQAAVARAQLLLAEGEADEARRRARLAKQLWQEVDAPYEASRARLLLGAAYKALGDQESAAAELQAARAVFQRLGAGPDAMLTTELLGPEAALAAPGSGRRVSRTFMFTDIVRSTNLVEAIGDEAWEDLIRWHDHTLRFLFAEHRGEEIDHLGDGFFVAFESGRAAAECAVAIQRTLAEHRRTQGFSPQVRIGLHATEAIRHGTDYRGKGVHEAARVGALAEAGEIVASQGTLHGLDGGFRLSEPRSVTVKGISEPLEIVSVEWR